MLGVIVVEKAEHLIFRMAVAIEMPGESQPRLIRADNERLAGGLSRKGEPELAKTDLLIRVLLRPNEG